VDAEKNFVALVDKVCAEGISIDLERDHQIVARLTPARPRPSLAVGDLNAFLRQLPPLGDDAEAFADNLRAIRGEFQA
jgi:hypothetical protein